LREWGVRFCGSGGSVFAGWRLGSAGCTQVGGVAVGWGRVDHRARGALASGAGGPLLNSAPFRAVVVWDRLVGDFVVLGAARERRPSNNRHLPPAPEARAPSLPLATLWCGGGIWEKRERGAGSESPLAPFGNALVWGWDLGRKRERGGNESPRSLWQRFGVGIWVGSEARLHSHDAHGTASKSTACRLPRRAAAVSRPQCCALGPAADTASPVRKTASAGRPDS